MKLKPPYRNVTLSCWQHYYLFVLVSYYNEVFVLVMQLLSHPVCIFRKSDTRPVFFLIWFPGYLKALYGEERN